MISSNCLQLLLMVSINKIAEQAIAILNQIKYPSHLVCCHQQCFFFCLSKKEIRRKSTTILGVRERCVTDESSGTNFTHVHVECHPAGMC